MDFLINKKLIGQLAEDLALQYLQKKGYCLVSRHFLKKWGEIDLVFYDKRKRELVFVEVKATWLKNNIEKEENAPEWHLTKEKINRLKKTVLSFLNEHPEWSKKRWRFDFLALIFLKDLSLKEIRHWDSLPFYY